MKSTTIIFDTETTELTKAEGTSLDFQPEMIEIYCLKVKETLKKSGKIKYKKIDSFHSYLKPQFPIPKYITKITGIDEYTVADAPAFLDIFSKLKKFFRNTDTLVAHNLAFDKRILRYELERISENSNADFYWPKYDFCTVEQSMHIKGYRLKNNELYQIATGKEIVGAHQAKVDVNATFESYKFLQR